MKYDLTVLVPGIREPLWQRLYDSIDKAFRLSWEMVIIGPYKPSEELLSKENVQYIEDWGTPIRSQQIGLTQARGEWITWAADDGEYYPDSLDVGFAKLSDDNMDYKSLVMGKYYEGSEGKTNPGMAGNDYYRLSFHHGNDFKYLPRQALMLNVGIVSKKLLYEVGGWDCQFEVCPLSYNDLAVRLQRHGVKFIVQNEMMYHCSHMPGHEGDHGPIHDGQTLHDAPLFAKMYNDESIVERICIPLDNWKNAPEFWSRRFGEAPQEV